MKAVNLLNILLISLICVAAPVFASEAGDKVAIADQLAREGIYDTALIFYNKALSINPNFLPALAGRANAMRHLQHPTADHAKKKKVKKKTEAKKKPPEQAPVTASAATPNHAAAATPAPAPAASTAAEPKATTQVKSTAPLTKPPVQTTTKTAPVETATTSKSAPSAQTEPATEPPKETKTEAPVHAPPKSEETETPASIELAPSTPHETLLPESAAPPVSAPPRAVPPPVPQARSGESLAPPWLVILAGATFVSLIVMAVLWLSPSLSSSRQQHDRLKNFHKSKGEG